MRKTSRKASNPKYFQQIETRVTTKKKKKISIRFYIHRFKQLIWRANTDNSVSIDGKRSFRKTSVVYDCVQSKSGIKSEWKVVQSTRTQDPRRMNKYNVSQP